MAERDPREAARSALDSTTPPAAIPRALRLRLTVAVPLVVCFLVMLSGFAALWISYPLFFRTSGTVSIGEIEDRVTLAFATVGGFTLLSLVAAMALAASFARPLRALASRMESLRRLAGEAAPGPDGHTEIGALGSAFQGVVDSVSSLVHDSHTLHSLEGGVVTTDPDGVITSFSAVAEKVLGCATPEAVGRPITDVVPSGPENEGFLRSLRAALAGTQRPSSAEAAIRTRGGRDVQLGYTISPLCDEEGRSLGIVLTFKDLAERKTAEQLMRRAENLAVLGSIAAGLAHEIRTPLGATRGLVELLREGTEPGSTQHTYTEKALASIDRIDHLTRDLLTIANPEPRAVEPVDVNALARRAVELCGYDRDRKAIEVCERYAPGLPSVQGDGERLYQALLNILRNAFEAANDGGAVTIETRGEGDAVTLAVHNTGSYIAPEEHKHLFTPFFTTKRRGTGLGLAIAHQIVRAHGGDIHVASAPGSGTTFGIELTSVRPLGQPAAAPALPAAPVAQAEASATTPA